MLVIRLTIALGKTNAAAYELYAAVGEANGCSLPLAFIFTQTTAEAEPNAKDRLLVQVLEWIKMRCPNIMFTLSDKDTSEINACRTVLTDAKHQLCYWHAIRYLEQRLANDKVPKPYDGRKAHKLFDFIDPTWAPGVNADEAVHNSISGSQTCRAPLMILKLQEQRVPIWPNPPKPKITGTSTFCAKEHRSAIVELFRTHLHQHPSIPINNKGTHETSAKIYCNAVKEMYSFCFEHELPQVWAYLWNRWYCNEKWPLWARSANAAIPRIKTTMIVESLWRVIKHQDLRLFSKPRLDLVAYILINNVIPRATLRLREIKGQRRIGRQNILLDWQSAFRTYWIDFSRPDEIRHVAKELKIRKSSIGNLKGREEQLALLEEEKSREAGQYYTDVKKWTCSCQSFLISRFLLCKHLVRETHKILGCSLNFNHTFFANLKRHHYSPFYHIPGIHTTNLNTVLVTDTTPETILQQKLTLTAAHLQNFNSTSELGCLGELAGDDARSEVVVEGERGISHSRETIGLLGGITEPKGPCEEEEGERVSMLVQIW
jgi:hypothetical protein